MGKSLNIIMLTTDYPPVFGGIGIHVDQLSKQLAIMGVQITVVLCRLTKNLYIRSTPIQNPEISGLTIIELDTMELDKLEREFSIYNEFVESREFQDIRMLHLNYIAFRYLDKLVRNGAHYDIVHIHQSFLTPAVVSFSKLHHIPLVTTMHADYNNNKNLSNGFKQYLYDCSQAIITVSNEQMDYLRKIRGINKNLYRIYNGVDFLRKMGELPKKDNIIFCGRLVDYKRCEDLIVAFYQLIKEEVFQTYRLTIIGDGPMKPFLQEMVCKLELQEQVDFLGHIEHGEVRLWMHQAKILVLPSIKEAFGLVAVESFAEGTCVICTEGVGTCEVVIDQVNGLIVPQKDTNALCNAMKKVLSDDKTRIQFEINGYNFAYERFQWNEVAKQTLDVYKNVLENFRKNTN